jgi:hypothetical protein
MIDLISSIYFTLFGVYITLEEILIMYIRYKYIKKVLNYDIEIVHGDQSSISFRVGHPLLLIY